MDGKGGKKTVVGKEKGMKGKESDREKKSDTWDGMKVRD